MIDSGVRTNEMPAAEAPPDVGGADVGAAGLDPAGGCEVVVEALTVRAREVAARVAVLQAELVGMVGEMAAVGGPTDVSLRQWVAWQCGLTPAEAGRVVELAERLGELPLLAETLASGARSEGAVLALARAATPETEAELVAGCESATAGQLQTLCRLYRRARQAEGRDPVESRARSWHDDEVGGQRVSALLDDLDGARWDAGLRLCHEDLVARWRRDTKAMRAEGVPDELVPPRPTLSDALVRLADAYRDPQAAGRTGPPKRVGLTGELCDPNPERDPEDRVADEAYEVVVEAPIELLDHLDASHAAAGDPTPDEPATEDDATPPRATIDPTEPATEPPAELLAALEAAVIPVRVRSGHRPDGVPVDDAALAEALCEGTAWLLITRHGLPLWLTTAGRNANRSQRRALAHRDPTCRAPGCGATHNLIPHHIEHHANHGPTHVANLVLLCKFHHGRVHRGHRIEPDDAGGWRWYDAHGRLVPYHPHRAPPANAPPPTPTQLRVTGTHEHLTHWAADTILHRWLTHPT